MRLMHVWATREYGRPCEYTLALEYQALGLFAVFFFLEPQLL